MKSWFNTMYLKAMVGVRNILESERGDTNFISILILLGIVVLLASVFMGFKNTIVGSVTNIMNGFAIK